MVSKNKTTETPIMHAPEYISHFFTDHVNGRFSASYTLEPTPGLKNSHYNASTIATPEANNAFLTPGAAEHIPKGE